MLDCKRSRESKWQRVDRAIIFLVAAAIITFAASGAGAQEKTSGTVLMSAQKVISLNVNQMDLQDVLRLIAEKKGDREGDQDGSSVLLLWVSGFHPETLIRL